MRNSIQEYNSASSNKVSIQGYSTFIQGYSTFIQEYSTFIQEYSISIQEHSGDFMKLHGVSCGFREFHEDSIGIHARFMKCLWGFTGFREVP